MNSFHAGPIHMLSASAPVFDINGLLSLSLVLNSLLMRRFSSVLHLTVIRCGLLWGLSACWVLCLVFTKQTSYI